MPEFSAASCRIWLQGDDAGADRAWSGRGLGTAVPSAAAVSLAGDGRAVSIRGTRIGKWSGGNEVDQGDKAAVCISLTLFTSGGRGLRARDAREAESIKLWSSGIVSRMDNTSMRAMMSWTDGYEVTRRAVRSLLSGGLHVSSRFGWL